MFERYTESARRAIFFARYEASQYGSPQIETEHLLLGILREREKMLPRLFLQKRLAMSQIRSEIENRIKRGDKIPTSVEMPLSSENRKVLELARETADKRGHKYVEPEHLLIGILRLEKCLGAQILTAQGVTAELIQREFAHLTNVESESLSPTRALLTMEHFLGGLKTLAATDSVHYFADNAEIIDGLGARWNRAEIESGFDNLFAPYAKRNAEYVVEGTLAETGIVAVYSVLWKNALLASEERAWMHRMTVILVHEAGEWKILFAQVTTVKPSALSPVQ